MPSFVMDQRALLRVNWLPNWDTVVESVRATNDDQFSIGATQRDCMPTIKVTCENPPQNNEYRGIVWNPC